jgi:hypothetical protein
MDAHNAFTWRHPQDTISIVSSVQRADKAKVKVLRFNTPEGAVKYFERVVLYPANASRYRYGSRTPLNYRLVREEFAMICTAVVKLRKS